MNIFTKTETVSAASASSLSTVTIHTKDFRGRGSMAIKIRVLNTTLNKGSTGVVAPTHHLRFIEEKSLERILCQS